MEYNGKRTAVKKQPTLISQLMRRRVGRDTRTIADSVFTSHMMDFLSDPREDRRERILNFENQETETSLSVQQAFATRCVLSQIAPKELRVLTIPVPLAGAVWMSVLIVEDSPHRVPDTKKHYYWMHHHLLYQALMGRTIHRKMRSLGNEHYLRALADAFKEQFGVTILDSGQGENSLFVEALIRNANQAFRKLARIYPYDRVMLYFGTREEVERSFLAWWTEQAEELRKLFVEPDQKEPVFREFTLHNLPLTALPKQNIHFNSIRATSYLNFQEVVDTLSGASGELISEWQLNTEA
jgi:hypothetical protein